LSAADARTVAIVEDHLLLAETLRAALERTGLRAHVLTPEQPLLLEQRLLVLRPDLALIDLDLGEFGESTPLIRALVDGGLRVLVVTGSTDRLHIAAALEQGAIGYQQKAAGFDALLRRTLLALGASGPLDPDDRAALLAEFRRHRADRDRAWEPFAALTQRERDTLRALAAGRTVAEIARQWVVSEATVRTHVRALLSKLGVPSQLSAVALALRSGWLRDDE
jgi:DNA-binding NarL/FixJ family response regulator